MPTYMRRYPSPMKVQVRGGRHLLLHHTKGFIRGAIALHKPASSGQHRSPDVWPDSGAIVHTHMNKNTKKVGGTAQAVRNDPLLTQLANTANAKTALLPDKAPWNNHTPDLAVFSISDQPISFRTSLPGPGDTEEKRGVGRRVTISAHPSMISTTWEFDRLGFPSRPAHVSTCNLPGACC